jgi:hypothetical protein
VLGPVLDPPLGPVSNVKFRPGPDPLPGPAPEPAPDAPGAASAPFAPHPARAPPPTIPADPSTTARRTFRLLTVSIAPPRFPSSPDDRSRDTGAAVALREILQGPNNFFTTGTPTWERNAPSVT